MMAKAPTPKDFMNRIPNQKSKLVQIKNLPASKMTDDVGLLPQTLIRPPNSDLPRLFSDKWKSRLKLEWLWAKSRAQNLGSLLWFIRFIQRKLPKSEKMRLNLHSRPSIALNLHSKFYTSLAAGDIPSLRKILCAGLLTKTTSQISYRKENQAPPQSWRIVKYTSPMRPPFSLSSLRFLLPWPLTSILPGTHAKIVSDRVAPFPVGKNSYIRQCIVRIRSLQELDKGDGSPPSRADLTEYLVMQQLKMEGQQAVWKIWGTTKPTSKEEVDDLIKEGIKSEDRITLMDRLSAMDPTKGF